MSTSVEILPPGERKHACTGCTAPKAEFKLGIHVFGGGHTNTTFFCAPCLNALVQQGFRALADALTSSLQQFEGISDEKLRLLASELRKAKRR